MDEMKFWPNTMNQDLTENRSIKIEQTYIKFLDKSKNLNILYSYPAILDDKIKDFDVLKTNLNKMNAIYEKCILEK